MDRLNLYCACGGHLHAEATGQDAALMVTRWFWESHTGEGHYPVTREEWARRHSDLSDDDTLESTVPVLAEDLILAP